VPGVVRPLADLPGCEGITAVALPSVNPEQLAAIEEPGIVFVSAGAGTGKTTVLVERYVKAVAERDLGVDGVLVITYTDRAAGELKERIRARLRELGRRDLSRAVDGAWISTIHGFCSRLLRAHPFEAGLDPRFRVLDEGQADVLRAEAFTTALTAFCRGREPTRLRLLATYGSRGLQTMLGGVSGRLRSAGLPLDLAPGDGSGLEARIGELRRVTVEALEGDVPDSARAVFERALEVAESGSPAETLLDLSELRLSRAAAVATGSSAFSDAVVAVERAALDEVAARDRLLLQELLVCYDEAYRNAKARESAADFEDLQLFARDLLRDHPSVRERARFRFRSIMVDEFQDTNRLQCELVDLIAGDELFFVGDEFQSIYRFRHADVDVFRERRSRSGGVLALTRNYRSRPEVLGVVNHLFGAEFGEAFEPLDAAATFADPLFGAAVEVLVTDKASYRGTGTPWRTAEARHVARRVRELVDDGACTPGDVVLLFAAGTSAEAYEEALRAQALPTYRATGRGYFGQQQVVDLLAYLRLVQNRYDDEALATVLASPLVGVSADALVLLRRAAGRRPLFTGLEREPPNGLSARDRRLVYAFRQRYDRLVPASFRLGLEQLCEAVVTEHDYDLAVLARWDGRRRYANLRKLGRLARSFEDLRGPDLEGFVRFVREQEAVGAREVEAVAEEEGAEAVRLLTIHAAKGLEFKVVVVCDAGRRGGRADPDEILCLPDGRFGFRVADPLTGKRHDAAEYDEIRRADSESEAQETRRLYYVAMTRAIDRLILAGSLDTSRSDPAPAPIGWVVDRLGAAVDEDGPIAVDAGGVPVTIRVDRAPAEAPPVEDPVAEQLELFDAPAGDVALPALELSPLLPVPEPVFHEISRLSYSALALFERCSYRFYAERIVGLRALPETPAPDAVGLSATEIGDAVHGHLEHGLPVDQVEGAFRANYPSAAEDDLRRVEALVTAWYGSDLAASLGRSADVRVELPFAFEHDGVLLHGRFDVFQSEGGAALVVDYKTNRLDGRDPRAVVESDYRLQRLVYALAALKGGAGEVRVVYAFLECPGDPVEHRYVRGDLPALEAGLTEAIEGIRVGAFVPRPSEFACTGCPALDRVCAGPRLPGYRVGDGGGWIAAEAGAPV
jgi:ATP-dependent exoDNAse (exonuclease V) beta subunit